MLLSIVSPFLLAALRIALHFQTTRDLPGLQIEFGSSVRIAEGTSAGRRKLARCLKRLHRRPLETRPDHIRAKARNFFWVEFPNLKQDPSPHIQTALSKAHKAPMRFQLVSVL
jgi:hypothetical protein